jgi:sialate O-acetylesterase
MPRPGLLEPTTIYNGMIHALTPFAVRGAIWYQGEANRDEGPTYFQKMQALINGWRGVFENPELSFYFVQLANFTADTGTPAGGTGYALIRDWQRRALSIPRTGMAVAIDVGNPVDIHPTNKQDVGLRLALWALARDYGLDVVCSGPLYRECAVEGNTIRLRFDHVGGGLMVGRKSGLAPAVEAVGEPLKRFAVLGKDGQWRWANAAIDGETVVVSSPEVAEPVAVRYAYEANPAGCNLYNRAGLPASPFTTE